MHHQPAGLNQSAREKLLLTFTGQVTSCLSLAWLGALKIFSIDMCAIRAVTNSWEVHMNMIDWTTFIIQWNLFFGTPLFSRHKIWSQKNFHIIFVSVTSIEGTPLFKERDNFSGPWEPGLPSIRGHLSNQKRTDHKEGSQSVYLSQYYYRSFHKQNWCNALLWIHHKMNDNSESWKCLL